ncbi:IucA/IucC family protein [Candidatus Nitrotoga sp. M5]|uniref:IucA/IucC family protein n=1 Tax=Candidatus Nitrotoga sp. M5 TaxID=2890409 RepID=UPI001EF35596|nr:IucA/IucC family protein [Candidatus Nitrotoga sp. M5]CAH1386615.1 Siderophore synthetase component [Candidatus Nitrotoga sp. M5]
MQPYDYQNLIDSPAYRQASRRVLRQLLEALLFEDALPHCTWHGETLTLPALRTDSSPVSYICQAQRTFSFGRLRITTPLLRSDNGVTKEASDPALFLAEIKPWLAADEGRLSQFAAELLATQIKDAQTLYARGNEVLRGTDYDTIEARLTDGHPYHPSYKSRLGFTLDDNAAYAPEFAPAVTPLLLAVRRDRSHWAVSSSLSETVAMHALLGEADWQRFCEELNRRGLQPEDYLPLPVHPWQWDEVILPGYHQALACGELLQIGPLSDRYLPQQSIRTLSNFSNRSRLSLKLAMNIVNTSASRVLPPHTVQNAAIIGDWLLALVERTDWSEPLARPVLLREVAGVCYTPLAPAYGQYGALTSIWRESIHTHLQQDEAAVPMTALMHVDTDGRPFIDNWVKCYGSEHWLRRLIERAWLPVLHLLWEHGVALESHAQNMILLHKDGLPARVALKDFDGGVLFFKSPLFGSTPALTAPPAEYLRVNPGSFQDTDNANELRDFTFDALFFVNLAELAWLFERFYDMTEEKFWQITREVLCAHQGRHPESAARYALFDCFADKVTIELLASRRFQPEIRLRTRFAPNPLAQERKP